MKLSRADLAVFLRLCEAIFGPGWAPKDAPVTPPGLLAGRHGRGAATDRLALLLLVLQTRSTGRVCLVGGSVAKKRGRCAATVSRLLGCSVSGGTKVLSRLVDAGVVSVPREELVSGAVGRSRLVVPAVANAHRAVLAGSARIGAAGSSGTLRIGAPANALEAALEPSSAGAASGDGWVQGSFEEVEPEVSRLPVGALGDLGVGSSAAGMVLPGISEVAEGGSVDLEVLPDGAALHALHASVVAVGGVSDGDVGGCSGSAGGGAGSQRECAGEREGDRTGSSVAGGRPLRGEQPTGVHFGGVPGDLTVVLEPVAWLWHQIGRESSRRWLARKVRGEVSQLAGLVGLADAQVVLGERLRRRWLAQGGVLVDDPVGWLVKRGLPQRAGCWSQLCDDGIRMDTGVGCAGCESLRGDRRAMRMGVLAQLQLQVAGLPVDRAVWEAEVHHQVQFEAGLAAVRRERAAEERVAREAAWALQAEEAREREIARLEAACVDCGLPQAAGRCPVCTWRSAAEVLLREAVDLLMAAPDAETGSVGERQALEELLRGDLDALVVEAVGEDAQDGPAAFARWSAAQRLRDGYRHSALVAWGRTAQARAEVDLAAGAALRRLGGEGGGAARSAAAAEGEQARARTAQFLLAGRLAQVVSARAVPRPRTNWAERWAELAARPLAHELPASAEEVAA